MPTQGAVYTGKAAARLPHSKMAGFIERWLGDSLIFFVSFLAPDQSPNRKLIRYLYLRLIALGVVRA
jgi:hypothetical protein